MVRSRKMEFDMKGTCDECGKRVLRLHNTKTWHHENIEDYKKCGYVEISKKYVLDRRLNR